MIVRLPLRSPVSPELPPEQAAPEPVAAEGQAAALAPTLNGLCILAVDDDVDNLGLTQWILENAGAEVVTLTSARDAIAALKAAPDRFDLLLADIGMPIEDGLTLMRQVRALDAAAGGQIPAVAITAYVSERKQQEAIAAGFQQYLAKPINSDQLIQMVANLARLR